MEATKMVPDFLSLLEQAKEEYGISISEGVLAGSLSTRRITEDFRKQEKEKGKHLNGLIPLVPRMLNGNKYSMKYDLIDYKRSIESEYQTLTNTIWVQELYISGLHIAVPVILTQDGLVSL
ncbi:hypothetical protein D5086_029414 [Populus alba]|uniref:Uncharacterized protein n=1 Tax=Populus alba TaxID=43335 RepID=A0ACC4AU49_POPAL